MIKGLDVQNSILERDVNFEIRDVSMKKYTPQYFVLMKFNKIFIYIFLTLLGSSSGISVT